MPVIYKSKGTYTLQEIKLLHFHSSYLLTPVTPHKGG